MHLEARALADRPADEGLQELVGRADSPDHLATAVGATGPFETHEINGREYILVATPHGT
jgi:hypothetical protein